MLKPMTILLCLLQICSDVSAQTLDYSFGVKGIVNMHYGTIYSVVQQTDGKIIAVGDGFSVIRYDINGKVDSNFGINGIVERPFGAMAEYANTVLAQHDNKILISGTAWINGNANFAIIRLNTDGSFDSTFSEDGRNIIDISGQDGSGGMALQPDGKIILCGIIASSDSAVIFRLNTDGTLDSAFNNNKVFFTYGSASSGTMGLNAVTIKPDGKILACGHLNIAKVEFSLIQLLQSGELDATFGNNGIVITPNTGVANDLALQPDGKIIVAGIGVTTGGGYMVRYMSDGIVDNSFGTNGHVLISHSLGYTLFEDVEIDNNGVIYATGQITNNISYQGDDMLLMRFTKDGSIDTDYAPNGIITKVSNYSEGTYGMLIQQDGRILTAGYSKAEPASKQFCMLRYWPYPLSVGAEAAQTSMKIFPNPASDVLHLESSQIVLRGSYYVITRIFGQTVQQGLINAKEIKISDIPAGVYILHVFESENTSVSYARFVKI